MRTIRMLGLLLLCLCLAASACGEAAPRELPLDFSPGKEPHPNGFDGDAAYSDPTITVAVEKGDYDGNTYWVARVKIAHPSQLRVCGVGDFAALNTLSGEYIAKHANAVLAVDSDFWVFSESGLFIREGKVIRERITGEQDLLAIDVNGDFRTYPMATAEDAETLKKDPAIRNVFSFGPILVKDGEAFYNEAYGDYYAAEWERQRMAIAQVGPLEYLCVCTGARARGSRGMTLREFADFVATFGVQTAYNLDGGDSTLLYFHGKRINDPEYDHFREISDIIYFASADD